ncbi:hypothetical protein, partial [Liquorilactobacillus satsumensis]|uniref:hypothetical protein n=1 Tax=Liquorilactobacillus satsumensis TaxID=259059 RepID=UPI0039EB06AC
RRIILTYVTRLSVIKEGLLQKLTFVTAPSCVFLVSKQLVLQRLLSHMPSIYFGKIKVETQADYLWL